MLEMNGEKWLLCKAQNFLNNKDKCLTLWEFLDYRVPCKTQVFCPVGCQGKLTCGNFLVMVRDRWKYKLFGGRIMKHLTFLFIEELLLYKGKEVYTFSHYLCLHYMGGRITLNLSVNWSGLLHCLRSMINKYSEIRQWH